MDQKRTVTHLRDYTRAAKSAHTAANGPSEVTSSGSEYEASRRPVWPEGVRSYLRQQIQQAANAKERADAVRLAQRLAQQRA